MAIHLTKIYTRTGDSGFTSLVGGQKVSKDHIRVESYGTLDELLSEIGFVRTLAQDSNQAEIIIFSNEKLARIQNELFDIGSLLACLPQDTWPGKPQIVPEQITVLENEIDQMNEVLLPLNSFVLPGGSLLNASSHRARTLTRKLERQMVNLSHSEALYPNTLEYINRLSDWLFVYSRWSSHLTQIPEYLWQTPLKKNSY